MTTRVLEIEDLHVNVRVRGRDRTIIHNSTLHVDEGESLGLVGESGSGKSMTIRAVVGMLPRRATMSGEVEVAGRSVVTLRRAELRRHRQANIALIHQDPRSHINPIRRVGDFMIEGLVARGVDAAIAGTRAVEALESVGIQDASRRMEQYPGQLSGGLLQRVMIASALIAEPRLLLADEPTTALDVTTQEEVMAIIDEQRSARRLSMLFVSHDLDLTAAVTDRIAVMYAGAIVEQGPTAGLHEAALHPYTVGLLNARPDVSAGRRLWAIPGRPRSAFEVGPGCVFSSRCPYTVSRCETERPSPRQIGEHVVACHRAEELAGKVDYSVAGAR